MKFLLIGNDYTPRKHEIKADGPTLRKGKEIQWIERAMDTGGTYLSCTKSITYDSRDFRRPCAR